MTLDYIVESVIAVVELASVKMRALGQDFRIIEAV